MPSSPRESFVAAQGLRDSALRQKVDALVLAIRCADGRTTFNPAPDEVVQAGDPLIMTGRLDTSTLLAQL